MASSPHYSQDVQSHLEALHLVQIKAGGENGAELTEEVSEHRSQPINAEMRQMQSFRHE